MRNLSFYNRNPHHPQEIGRCYNYEILKVLTLITTAIRVIPVLRAHFLHSESHILDPRVLFQAIHICIVMLIVHCLIQLHDSYLILIES